MPTRPLRHIVISLSVPLAMAFGFGANASGPTAPQVPQQPGQPITLEVDAHGNLFVDPLWPSGTQGTCRYLTNPSSSEWFVPIESQQEWQSMETSSDDQYSDDYATWQVCCRPSTGTQNATLCKSSAGGPQTAQIVGSDPTGYGVQGSTGSATATCSNPPYGSYAETQTFSCALDPNKPSSGVGADGAWSAETSDTDSCQSGSYTTSGGCSQSCSTGGSVGHIYETVYNSCGQVTAQGYSGPSCNMQSCCTQSVSYSCSGSSRIATYSGCGLPTISVGAGTCTATVVGAQCTCNPEFNDVLPAENTDGTPCEYVYDDCNVSGWTPGGCQGTCRPSAWEGLSWTTNCNGGDTGQNTLVVGQNCTGVTEYSP